MSNLFRPGAAEVMRARLRKLTPETRGQWGKMTSHQMVVHLADGFRLGFLELEVDGKPNALIRGMMKFVGFTLPIPWPKGAQTAPELDQQQGGTPPQDFRMDVADLEQLMDRFVATDGDLPEHPVWGQMSKPMTGRYAWRHMDHHLRQFGV